MTTLKGKLSRLRKQAGDRGKACQTSSANSDLRSRLDGIGSNRIKAVTAQPRKRTTETELAKRLKGYSISEGVIQIQQRLPLDGVLGHPSLILLRDTLRLPGEGRQAHLRQVYVDTETTGLSGGSGTIAFLIGMAMVAHDALVVTQYLITRFGGESAMLTAFARALTADYRLVSYNGKSFDLPLLVTRYRMQGVSQPFDELPHLDLLHPVRRLFGKRWPDCRLTTLEEQLLGFRRRHDLPGAEAPAAWSDYVREGDAERLIRVVVHNRQDIVSLALGHAMLVQATELPQRHDADIAALAQWLSLYDSTGAYVLLKSMSHSLDDRGKRLLGQLARRTMDWPLALRVWEELAEKGCRDSAEQLAKYHEHVSRDLDIAHRYCEQLKPGAEKTRRLQRIQAKQYRKKVVPQFPSLPIVIDTPELNS